VLNLIGWPVELVQYAPYAVAALIAGLVLLKWPFAGLLVMAALIPGEELTTFFGERTLIWTLGVAVLGAWALRTLVVGKKIWISKCSTWMALLWLVWGLFSVFWAWDRGVAFGQAVTLAQLIVFFCLIQVMVIDDRRLQTFIIIYFVGSTLFAMLAIGRAVSADLRRATLAQEQNPNSFARALGVGLLMVPYLLKNHGLTRWRFLTLLGGFALGLAILLTGSRGAWVGLVATFGFTWLISKGRLCRLRSIAVVAVVVAAGIAGLYSLGFLDEWIVQRMLTLPDIEATYGGAGRTNIWAVGWEMVKANPLVGVGLGNFPVRFEDFIDVVGLQGAYGVYPGRDPHNVFLSVQAELGIIGLFIVLTFFWTTFRKLLPYRRDLRAITGILLLSFMVFSGIPATIQYRKFFWLALGLATVVPKVIHQGQQGGVDHGKRRPTWRNGHRLDSEREGDKK